ncbi:MAG: tetratricopeptide repeat protein [Vicinamibacterales bacterium]
MNTLLVWSIGRRLLDWWPATAGAALFAVHAVHTEAVSPVFGRADLLAASFVLLAWRLAIASREPRRSRTAAVTLLFAGGLLAKENAAAFPALLVFSDLAMHVRRRTFTHDARELLRQRWSLYAALLIGAAGYSALRYAAAGGVFATGSHVRYIENPLVTAEPAARLLTALWVAIKYVGLFILPYPLSADYAYDQIPLVRTAADPRAIAVAAALGGAVVLLARLERRVPRTILLAGAFAVLLLPVSNLIVPIGTIMAERILYLPSAALCLLSGLWLVRLHGIGGPRMKIVLAWFIIVLLGAHTAGALARNRDWSSEERLFSAAVRASPASAKARFNYASALVESGQTAAARAMLESAVAIAPAYPEAHNLLGTLALLADDLSGAGGSFEAALGDAPEYAPALANLGTVRRREGRLAEARTLLERAVAADPSMAVAHVNLGLVAELQGDHEAALEHYRRAYALDASLDVARQRADALDRRGYR